MISRIIKGTYCCDEATRRLFGAIVTGGQLNDQRRALIDLTIRRLKGSGMWDKLALLYVPAAKDSFSARINWKNPGTTTLTATGSPGFTGLT